MDKNEKAVEDRTAAFSFFRQKKNRSCPALELMPAAICDLPYEGAKEMLLVDEIDDKEFLIGLFKAMYDELPSPKRKKNK